MVREIGGMGVSLLFKRGRGVRIDHSQLVKLNAVRWRERYVCKSSLKSY